eukprot:6213061-Pleurochrysis_carterae.AAC.6
MKCAAAIRNPSRTYLSHAQQSTVRRQRRSARTALRCGRGEHRTASVTSRRGAGEARTLRRVSHTHAEQRAGVLVSAEYLLHTVHDAGTLVSRKPRSDAPSMPAVSPGSRATELVPGFKPERVTYQTGYIRQHIIQYNTTTETSVKIRMRLEPVQVSIPPCGRLPHASAARAVRRRRGAQPPADIVAGVGTQSDLHALLL